MAEETTETATASETQTKKSSSAPKILFIACGGCLVLLAVAGIVLAIGGRVLFSKFGLNFMQKAVENKTGIKANLTDLEQGKLSITDKESGTTMDIGSGKIPDNFPKDFPIYPGAKVTSVLSGTNKAKNGFWVTLETGDSLDKVAAFYKSELAKNGWEVSATYTTEETMTEAVTKGKLEGNLTINRSSSADKTEIVIMLGAKE